MRRGVLIVGLLILYLILPSHTMADSPVDTYLIAGEAVSFHDQVSQGNHILLDLQTTGDTADYYVVTPDQFANWENDLTFTSVDEGSISILASSPIMTKELDAGTYYVILENSHAFVRLRIFGTIDFDYVYIPPSTTTNTTTNHTTQAVLFPMIPAVVFIVAATGTISLVVFIINRKPRERTMTRKPLAPRVPHDPQTEGGAIVIDSQQQLSFSALSQTGPQSEFYFPPACFGCGDGEKKLFRYFFYWVGGHMRGNFWVTTHFPIEGYLCEECLNRTYNERKAIIDHTNKVMRSYIIICALLIALAYLYFSYIGSILAGFLFFMIYSIFLSGTQQRRNASMIPLCHFINLESTVVIENDIEVKYWTFVFRNQNYMRLFKELNTVALGIGHHRCKLHERPINYKPHESD